VEKKLEQLESVTGRSYRLYEYVGAIDATQVIVVMGSAAETVRHTVEHLQATGEKVGLMKVRLFRPFGVESFVSAFPDSVRQVLV
jgi:pyruvate-ferredoxin/flavodoxin oxidoreductase